MNCLKKLLTCSAVIFSFFSSGNLRAQSLEQTFQFANEMKQEGNYNAAIKLFQRVSFFGKDFHVTDCYLGTADCYYLLNDFPQAENFYELAYFSTQSDSLRDLISLSRSAIFIYDKKYLEALQELFSTSDDEKILRTKNIYLATTYYGLNRFDEARNTLFEIEKDSASREELDELFAKAKRAQKINPKTAKVLSMILPGLGQFYCGDVKNGLNSLLITSAFMYLTATTVANYSIVEATSVLPWFSRYYMGGFKRAETICISRVEEKQFKIFQKITAVIQ